MNGVLNPRGERVAPNRQNRINMEKKKMRSKFMSNPCDNVATYGCFMNPRSSSYPFEVSSSFLYHQQNQQPPLLPLPTVSPPSVKSPKNRRRDMSNNKSKQTVREQVKKKPTQFLTAPVVCTSSFRSTAMAGNGFGTEMASWVFNLSPPPSSLPLPKFLCQKIKVQLQGTN